MREERKGILESVNEVRFELICTNKITSKIVAWSRWHFPRPLKDEERGKMDPDYFADIPPGSNIALCEEWFSKLEEVEFKYIDREGGFCMSIMFLSLISFH